MPFDEHHLDRSIFPDHTTSLITKKTDNPMFVSVAQKIKTDLFFPLKFLVYLKSSADAKFLFRDIKQFKTTQREKEKETETE